jgi:hypothetical protein
MSQVGVTDTKSMEDNFISTSTWKVQEFWWTVICKSFSAGDSFELNSLLLTNVYWGRAAQ